MAEAALQHAMAILLVGLAGLLVSTLALLTAAQSRISTSTAPFILNRHQCRLSTTLSSDR
jgi:hypothetical protein